MKTIFKVAIAASFVFFISTAMRVHPISRVILSQDDTTAGLFEPGTQPKLISKQFSFTEGASTDKKGNVFFTDQNNNKIWKYDTDGNLTLFMDSAGRSNGMYIDKKGNLIACADENEQLWSISPDKKVTVLLKDYKGHLFNGPNDVWVNRKTGGLYITDPYYQRPWWTRRKSDLDGQKVYYLPKNATEPIIVADGLLQPNGIVGTPDGKYLYVADIKASKTYRYNINKDGTLSEKTLFTASGSDGMTLDSKGNIYLTGKGVTIFNPEGKQIAHIAINEPWTANICFSGKHKDVLFLTSSKAVYTFQMKVKGVE
jgi:gluconolactonase